uniref:Major facilitator superfamily (MFS) profile domain-containing protein n=2 Tax=Photinus pyralis TaxID=7054 RepID=A0A1Y1LQU3_PHOPY
MAADSSSSSSATAADRDIEAQQSKRPRKHSHWSVLIDQAGVDDAVLNHKYPGQGTHESPYLVDFLPADPRNPMTFSRPFKWTIMIVAAISTLAVSFTSSAYSGSILSISQEFHASTEVTILGVSMFVLGFAIGPLFWAPFSELYGRQKLFSLTYMALTAFNAAAAGAPNMAALIVLRFMAGAWGSSPLTNSGGIIADLFTAKERGIATSVFAIAPFLGPALGPIAGGFLAEAQGWRWVEGLTAIFTGALWIIQSLVAPETYSPVLLRRRAEELSKRTGKVYISKVDAAMPRKTLFGQIKVNLSRPWVLLFKEPIVFLTSIYMAILYGTLYLCFAAFPIVFQSPYPQGWGWRPGVGGLSFVGIAIGMIASATGSILDNGRYARTAAKHGGVAPPEARLPPAIAGSVLLPVGLFWFSWTNGTNVHWVVPIIGSSIFAAGLLLVFLSLLNYLIDSYVIYAASVLAASAVLRSLFGCIFPLFTGKMYEHLGVHWASSIPAFLALACMPFPFLFYRYGEKIRLKCKYSAEASHILEKILAQQQPAQEDEGITECEEGGGEKGNQDTKTAPTTEVK